MLRPDSKQKQENFKADVLILNAHPVGELIQYKIDLIALNNSHFAKKTILDLNLCVFFTM